MKKLNVDIQSVFGFIDRDDLKKQESSLKVHHHNLISGTGAGNDFTGWVRLPSSTTPDLLRKIKEAAMELKEKSEIVVVVGIGGSYLGARAVIEALQQMKETIKDATVDLYIDDNCGGGYDAGSIRLYELDGNYMVEFSG